MKITQAWIFLAALSVNSLAIADTLTSISKAELENNFLNKTWVSIATDNLNGQTIDNTFSMFLDKQGHIFGKMSHKPATEPQMDKGVYEIAPDGTFYITWQHWDGAKKLCGHLFDTKNAFMSVDCAGVFHTAFMKSAVKNGNHLQR